MAAKGAGKSGGGKKTTIKSAGKAPVKFTPGGLHKSTGTPAGQPIPAAKMAAAKAGKFGPKAAKQANMAAGLLAAGRKTAAKNRGGKKGS
jgi:hypothetical protein